MSGGIGHLVLSGPLILAVPVAAAAGAVTFLSPCVLPLVPGYLSYVAGMSGVDAQASPAAGDGRPAGTGSAVAACSTVATSKPAAAVTTVGTSSTAATGSPAPGAGGGGTAVKAPAATVAAS